ncbi:MAG: pilin [Candidatus Paceibacterota bacterium]|jgi:hypothetical protein
MKKLILISLLIFPLFVSATCSDRPLVNQVNHDNCVWQGEQVWDASTCTCYENQDAYEDATGGGSTSGGDSPSGTVSTGNIPNPVNSTSFTQLLETVIDWILDIGLVLAPLAIVYGGILHITAAGSPEKSSQGKKVILYAAIGLIVILLAKSLVGIIEELVVI